MRLLNALKEAYERGRREASCYPPSFEDVYARPAPAWMIELHNGVLEPKVIVVADPVDDTMNLTVKISIATIMEVRDTDMLLDHIATKVRREFATKIPR